MQLITDKDLCLIAPTLPPRMAGVLAPLFCEIAPKYGLDTRQRFEAYIATCAYESVDFSRLSENLIYRAERLMKIWPQRFPEVIARQAAGNPRMTAMIAYGKRKDSLGNTTAEDGWIFRGSGPIIIRGKALFAAYTAYVNKRDGTTQYPEDMAEKIRYDWSTAIDCSCWVYCVAKKLIEAPYSIAGKFDDIAERINSRSEYYAI